MATFQAETARSPGSARSLDQRAVHHRGQLQVDDRGARIADAINHILEPRGVIVVIECEHLCMTMRGVRKPGSKTITSAVRGQLRNAATRAEAMGLITS